MYFLFGLNGVIIIIIYKKMFKKIKKHRYISEHEKSFVESVPIAVVVQRSKV